MFHNGFALILRRFGEVDKALVEYAAASYHFDLAGHRRFHAKAEQNLASLYMHIGQFPDAHEHLDHAERVLLTLRDQGATAELFDLRAQIYLSEGKPSNAEIAAQRAVEILERGDEHALVVDSLVTYAKVLEVLKRENEALEMYVRAYNLASTRVGSRRAAEIAFCLVAKLTSEVSLNGHLTHETAVDLFERNFIKASLDATDGNQKETALRLGMKQQTLSYITTKRFPELNPSPGRKRRQISQVKKLSSAKLKKA